MDPHLLAGGELDLQGCDDVLRDLVLQGEQVGHLAVVPLGPQVVAGQRVDELGGDAHLVP